MLFDLEQLVVSLPKADIAPENAATSNAQDSLLDMDRWLMKDPFSIFYQKDWFANTPIWIAEIAPHRIPKAVERFRSFGFKVDASKTSWVDLY